MDGPWQMEAKTATEYGRIAQEAAKMMRWVDPSIELAAAGSSGRRMPTYGTWEDTVLQHTFDQVEYISLHTYLNNYEQDTPAFLASVDLMDNFIEEVVAIADAVAARRRSSKRIMLSFDEWNVWYRTRRKREDRVKEGWPVAPPNFEETTPSEDALAFGGCCISLLNHADRVDRGLPRPARERDRADHDRNRRPRLASDDLPSLRRFQPPGPWPRVAHGNRLADLFVALLRPAGADRRPLRDPGGALPEARRRARRQEGIA